MRPVHTRLFPSGSWTDRGSCDCCEKIPAAGCQSYPEAWRMVGCLPNRLRSLYPKRNFTTSFQFGGIFLHKFTKRLWSWTEFEILPSNARTTLSTPPETTAGLNGRIWNENKNKIEWLQSRDSLRSPELSLWLKCPTRIETMIIIYLVRFRPDLIGCSTVVQNNSSRFIYSL